MEEEKVLAGGRITKNVTQKGNSVFRPCCSNSDFVHDVLLWLERKGSLISPYYKGINNDGREIITFLEGNSPNDLGDFSDDQLFRAGKIIKNIHELLKDYPGCMAGQTVCHNDLSPCNFMFKDNLPYAAFDWDTAKIGDPKDDLAYAVKMWCDIGNPDQTIDDVNRKIKIMIKGYDIAEFDLENKILIQLDRLYDSVWESQTQTEKFRLWISECRQWILNNEKIFHNIF